MLDLGVSINAMSAFVYRSLRLGNLEPTGVIIQLANRSVANLLGISEYVLIQVKDQIFLADFYVLDMEDELSNHGATLMLGRPFLMTTRTMIDVHARTLFIEFDDNMVQLNIFEAMKHLTENHSVLCLDVIDLLADECTYLHYEFHYLTYFSCTCDGSIVCSIYAKINVVITANCVVAANFPEAKFEVATKLNGDADFVIQ